MHGTAEEGGGRGGAKPPPARGRRGDHQRSGTGDKRGGEVGGSEVGQQRGHNQHGEAGVHAPILVPARPTVTETSRPCPQGFPTPRHRCPASPPPLRSGTAQGAQAGAGRGGARDSAGRAPPAHCQMTSPTTHGQDPCAHLMVERAASSTTPRDLSVSSGRHVRHAAADRGGQWGGVPARPTVTETSRPCPQGFPPPRHRCPASPPPCVVSQEGVGPHWIQAGVMHGHRIVTNQAGARQASLHPPLTHHQGT